MAKHVITYPDAKEWAYILDSVAVLVEEAVFTLRQDGLALRTLDPSRVAMVDLFIPKEGFEGYPELDSEVKIGVDLKHMRKLFRGLKRYEKIVMELDGPKLKMKLMGKSVRSITLPLAEIVGEDLPTPKVAFTATVKTASDVLDQAMKDVEVVADDVKFDVDEEALYIRASSDKGDVEVRLGKKSELVYEFDVKEPASAAFSMDYLTDITGKASRVSNIVTVQLATAKPISLAFDIPAGGKLTYFLAPRVE